MTNLLKPSAKVLIKTYLLIIIGAFMMGMGYSIFQIPANLASGGVTGVSIILSNFFKTPVGTLVLIMNIPIFLLGLRIFGATYGKKTLIATFLLSFFIDIIPLFINITPLFDFNKGANLLLAAIYGGALVGFGLAMINYVGGSTGGTDILAQTLTKYLKIPFGSSVVIIDLLVLMAAAFIFGLEISLYSAIALFTAGFALNRAFKGNGQTKMLYVISDKYEELREYIIKELGRGGTSIPSKGLYSHKEKNMIITVLRNKEIYPLINNIKKLDKKSFVIITDVYGALGEGFIPIEKDFV